MQSPQEHIQAYEQALATQSWEKVAPLIHEQCVAVFSEGTYIGIKEVEAAFRKTFSLINDEKYSIQDIHWVQQASTYAILTYKYFWSGIIDGELASGSGRGTSVLVKDLDEWKIICEHLGPLAR